MNEKNKKPKTIEHDESEASPYNWYITDNYDAIAAAILIGLAIYYKDEFKAWADWLVGNV